MNRMLDRILLVEKKVKDVSVNEEGEFNRRFELLEGRLMEGVREETRLEMEKMRTESERNRRVLEEEGLQRQGYVERLERVVRMQKKELERKLEEVGKVKQEM